MTLLSSNLCNISLTITETLSVAQKHNLQTIRGIRFLDDWDVILSGSSKVSNYKIIKTV